MLKLRRAGLLRIVCLLTALLIAVSAVPSVLAEEGGTTRWKDAADKIDEWVDTAFEYYLAGDASNAYTCVNNAYFRVYETTGMERQTMSYVSGPRKNAVELQYSTCKAAVKKSNETVEERTEVRTALNKLKTMIREDANKLAAKDGEVSSVLTWHTGGKLEDGAITGATQVFTDPYADLAGDDSAVHYANWAACAEAMTELLDTSYTSYKGKDMEAAVDNLNTAFYSVYEESGFSHQIYAQLSIPDREAVDAAFTACRDIINGEKFQPAALQRSFKSLKRILASKASAIDAKTAEAAAAETAADTAETAAADTADTQSSARWTTFLASFGIIVREGLEAILVIAAIIAYLAKSGNQKSLRNVYIGAVLGIVASFIAAAILYFVKQAVAGAGQSQEIIEGATALIAVCVLFYVSNWMISKSEAQAWSRYIDGKVQSSVETGSAFALAFTAFLSVFREGAEVVLFYQPMLTEANADMVWIGFAVGCVVLVFVYLAITKLSIRLPLKVFFTATSILMAVMCVAFLGSAVKEFAEGGVFDVTLNVPFIPDSEALQVFGIYPYLETLIPQVILTIVLIVTFLMAHYRNKLALKDAEIKRLSEAKA